MEAEYSLDLSLHRGRDLETDVMVKSLLHQGVKEALLEIESVAAITEDEEYESEAE